MKQKILSIYEIIDKCTNIQSEYARLQAEQENNTRPALNLPRPDKKSTLEKRYTDLWRQKYLENDGIRLFCIIVGAVLILAYIVLLWFDVFRGTDILLYIERIPQKNIQERAFVFGIEFFFRIILPVILAILPVLIFRAKRVPPTV
ncbi:MAG: hypothetical protein ACI4EN_00890, partial [Butyrivibrio sp.]